MNIGAALEFVSRELNHPQEAEILLSTALGLRRSEIYLAREKTLSPSVMEQVNTWTRQRRSGVPLQYVLGEAPFLDHTYRVAPGVLIPRPETELLVAYAIDVLSRITPSPRIGFEWGLGSGVISIELCHFFKGLTMVAAECSDVAIRIARENNERILGRPESHRLQPFQVDQSDSLAEIETKIPEFQNCFDFMISNPPYLDESSRDSELTPEVFQHEPHEALFPASEDPLAFYQSMALRGSHWLKPRGVLFAEIPHERADQIKDLFSAQGWRAQVRNDLTSRPRVLMAYPEVMHG